MTWTPHSIFFAAGDPVGQPRPRARAMKMGQKFIAQIYNLKTSDGWKMCIAAAANPHRPRMPLEGPIRVDIDFIFSRPQHLCRHRDPAGEIPHTIKPDVDNAVKCALDSLVKCGFIKDDSQVCQMSVRKLYCVKGSSSGARFRISVPSQASDLLPYIDNQAIL